MTEDVDIVVAANMNHLKTVLLRESKYVATTALDLTGTKMSQAMCSRSSWTDLYPNLRPHRHTLGPGDHDSLYSERGCGDTG